MTERDVAMTPDGREIYCGLAFSGIVAIRKILDFFKAPRNGDSDIYWIDASFIGKLKEIPAKRAG